MSAADQLVQVTTEHIAKGRPNLCGWCPLTYAVRDKLGLHGMERVLVYSDRIEVGWNKKYRLPEHVTARIEVYDKTGKMEPFAFLLKP